MTKRVTTTCTRDCPGCCGLVAEVRGGRVVSLTGDPDHPVTRGRACGKTAAYVKRLAHPERVPHPLRKSGGKSGTWRRVSWEQALDELAGRLMQALDEHGPESILNYQGFGERTALTILNARFFALLGGVTTLTGTLCSGTAIAAQNLDMGRRISHDPLDHMNARAIVLWGRNPAVTQVPMTPLLRAARERNEAPILLIDPVRSESAKALADHFIQPRPGTDGFLALAAARIILNEGLEDGIFLAKHADNVREYLDLLGRQDLSRLLAACDVPEADARLLARTMARRPAAVLLGWGLHRHKQAHHSVRAIDALAALTGNIGLPGGGVSQGFDEYGPYDQSLWGEDLHPPRRKLSMPRIGAEILAAQRSVTPLRVAVISAANPVCMAPNSGLVAEAFDSIPFVAHMGHFLDDTSDHADLFLPCAAFLEETDIVAGYGHNFVGPVNKAMEAPGECRPMFHIFRDLARRIPAAGMLDRSDEEWLRRLVRPLEDAGVSLERVMAGPVRIPWAPMAPYADRRFPTDTGNFRFLTEFGLQEPGSDGGYHFLTTGGPRQICSERTMDSHTPLPVLRVHPEEAARLGLADGDEAAIGNGKGELRVALKLDAGLRRDTLVAERGGWLKAGHGVNLLTTDEESDLGRGTPYYGARVWLRARNEA